jgi:hypothetical protein
VGAVVGEDKAMRILKGRAGDGPGRQWNAKLLGGGISCAVGLLLAAGEVYAALHGGDANISAGALGLGFGVLGYFLGPRWLATATVFLCTAAILFRLAAAMS